MAVQELPKGIDADAVRSKMNNSEQNYQELEQAWDGLVVEHEGEWVASCFGKFVFGSSPQAVLEYASKMGWPLDVLAIDHLSRERPAILL